MSRNSQHDMPWEKLFNYVRACGSIHEPYQFAVEILAGLQDLCDYDQALAFFLDANQKVYNQYLFNIDEQWSNLYLEYYSKILGRHGIHRRIYEPSGQAYVSLIDWTKEPKTDFISDYINALGLQYSIAFVLFDLNSVPRTAFAIDRTQKKPFSAEEISTLKLIVPHLNNLHKNFYVHPTGVRDRRRIMWESAGLTDREMQVVNLLCKGVSTNNISKILHITSSTTYKHIAHIYEKMHVSSQQELLVRMLNEQE